MGVVNFNGRGHKSFSNPLHKKMDTPLYRWVIHLYSIYYTILNKVRYRLSPTAVLTQNPGNKIYSEIPLGPKPMWGTQGEVDMIIESVQQLALSRL